MVEPEPLATEGRPPSRKRGPLDDEEVGPGHADNGDTHPHREEKGQGIGDEDLRGGKRARIEAVVAAEQQQSQPQQHQPSPPGVPAGPPIQPSSSSSSSLSAATGVLSSGVCTPGGQTGEAADAEALAAAAAAAAALAPQPGDDFDVEALIQATMGDMEAAAEGEAGNGGAQRQQPQHQGEGGSGGGHGEGQTATVPEGAFYHQGSALGASSLAFSVSPFYVAPNGHGAASGGGGDGGMPLSPLHEPPPQEEGGAHPYSFPDDTPLVEPGAASAIVNGGGGGERYDPALLQAGGSGGSVVGSDGAGGGWQVVHSSSWGSAGGGDGGGGGGGGGFGRRTLSADEILLAGERAGAGMGGGGGGVGVQRKASISSAQGAHGHGHGHGHGPAGRSSKSIMQRIEKHKVLQGWEDDWLWDEALVFAPSHGVEAGGAGAPGTVSAPSTISPEKNGHGWGLGVGGTPSWAPPGGADASVAGSSVAGGAELPLSPVRPAVAGGEKGPGEPATPSSPVRQAGTTSPTVWDRIGPDFQAALPELRRDVGPLPPPALQQQHEEEEQQQGQEQDQGMVMEVQAGEEEAEGPTLLWSLAMAAAGADASYEAVAAATGGGRAAVPAWTAEEAAAFEEGIRLYRRNFGKISRHCVPTRTVREVVARFYGEWKRHSGYRAWKAESLVGRRVLLERTKPPWKCFGGQDPIERVTGTVLAASVGEDGDEILDVRYEDGRTGQLYRYEAEKMLNPRDDDAGLAPAAAAAAAGAAAAVTGGEGPPLPRTATQQQVEAGGES